MASILEYPSKLGINISLELVTKNTLSPVKTVVPTLGYCLVIISPLPIVTTSNPFSSKYEVIIVQQSSADISGSSEMLSGYSLFFNFSNYLRIDLKSITMSELAPPRKSVELEDPGAHELGLCPCGIAESRL